MQTIDPSKFLLFDWDVTFGTFAFGGVDEVTPDFELVLKEKKVGSVGDVVLGHWIVALTGKIVVAARQMDHALFQQSLAWNAGATNVASVPLFPSDANGAPKDMYDYAKQLVLHPSHLDVADTSLNVTLAKAYPQIKNMGADGSTPNKQLVEFGFYLDRTKLPDKVYGWIGPPVP